MDKFIRSRNQLVINSHSVEIIEFDENGLYDKLPEEYGIEMPFSLDRAVAKRKAEFIAGRIACRRLLDSYGNSGQVSINADRSPAWPDGFTGSISHDGRIACAVVLPRAGENSGIGIDLCVSMTDQNALEVADNICIFNEISQFDSIQLPTMDALRVIFSAEESLYKSIYPIIRRFVDFKEVLISSVTGTPDEGIITFTAANRNDLPLSVVEEFHVHYRRFGHNGITGFITLACNRISCD